MVLTTSTSLSDLENRGFLHIPAFFSQKELEILCNDFEKAAEVDTDNYVMKRVSSSAFEQISEKLQTIVKLIQNSTGSSVDKFDGTGMYFPNWKDKATLSNPEPSLQKFPWHQDHESYFLLQDHSQYFNLYLPIIKPIIDKSNLTLIPNDKLKGRVPQVYEKLVGRGATRVVKDGSQDVILDDNNGGIIARLDFDIAEIEETPSLQAGDLLLIKGDVLHKTQDASTQRVAVSFRLLNTQSLVRRQKLIEGGLVKTVMMLNSWQKYELELRYFDLIQSDVATFESILKYIEHNSVPSNFKKIHFLLRLLGERWQKGNIFKMFLDLRFLNLILQK